MSLLMILLEENPTILFKKQYQFVSKIKPHSFTFVANCGFYRVARTGIEPFKFFLNPCFTCFKLSVSS